MLWCDLSRRRENTGRSSKALLKMARTFQDRHMTAPGAVADAFTNPRGGGGPVPAREDLYAATNPSVFNLWQFVLKQR